MSRLVVAISHVEFTETDQTFYVIRVQQDADEWEVRRAYSDFRHLRDGVHRVLKDDKHQLVNDEASRTFYKGVHDLPFPHKRLFGSKKDHVVKDRAVELHHFLIKLLFLTHAYRKAQKHLYDDNANSSSVTNASNSRTSTLVRKPHGSASIFFLLRDFLKPSIANARGVVGANANCNDHQTDTDDEQEQHARMLRESRMLNMRTSQQTKTMSAPQLQQQPGATTNSRSRANTAGLLRTTTNANALTPRRGAPPPPPHEPIAPEALAAVTRSLSRVEVVEEPTEHHVHFGAEVTAMSKPRTKSVTRRPSAATPTPTPTLAPTPTPTDAVFSDNADTRTRSASRRFHDRISNADFSYPALRAIASDYDLIATTPDPQPRSLSTSSTASSTASVRGGRPASNTISTDVGFDNANTNSSTSSGPGSNSSRRRPRRSGANSSSSLSASASASAVLPSRAELEQRTSERLSRLTPQLTAQSITIEAQKALEKHVSEYKAIMVLRYVDRFISKAVGKTPGCYTVVGSKLVIDSARFVEELDDVFPDLPAGIQLAFKNAAGEWVFPKALDAYVQMKWHSFQGHHRNPLAPTSGASTTSSHSGRKNQKTTKSKGKSSRRGTAKSDSDDDDDDDDDDDSDSESEYEFEDTGGFMKKKERAFTQEESDVLQMMIADGTAGREQMLRLRRQFDERGWQRQRKMPHAQSSGSLVGSDTDDDDDATGSGNESIKRFQEMQNRMRKSRMSRHDEGGLV